MLYEIERVENGYIVKKNIGSKSVYPDLLSVFKDMLLSFEGMSENFSNTSYYAKINIEYEQETTG